AAISAPAFSSTSRLRATMVTSTPSRASAKAQACPRPRLAPLSSACRPRSPRSIFSRSLRPSRATAEIRSHRFGIWRYSRCDGRNGPDLVAVLLVESELLHYENSLGGRSAVGVGERLAKAAGRKREPLHQQFHRHWIDRRISEVQQR